MARRRFSEHDVIETLYYQGIPVLCFRCKKSIDPDVGPAPDYRFRFPVQREHISELALGGKDVPVNCAYSHTDCHAVVTNGTKATSAGSSKNRIAKATHENRTAKFIVNKREPGEPKPVTRWTGRKFKKRKTNWPKRPFQKRAA